MIKSIVFDLGNVLIDFDPMRFVREKTTDPQKQKMLVSEIFGSVDWLRYDKGTMTKDELFLSVKTRLPRELRPLAEELLASWYNGLTPATYGRITATIEGQGLKCLHSVECATRLLSL